MKKIPCIMLFLGLWGGIAHAELRTWTNLKGETVRADILGVNNDVVYLRMRTGQRFKYPLTGLVESDREYVKTWRDSRVEQSRPTGSGTAGLSLSESAIGKLVSSALVRPIEGQEGFRRSPLSMSATPKFYAFYYSARWCPPCRGFTPELVEFYDQMKARGADFEIIFVTRDKNEAEMHAYMKSYGMKWPAVRFDVARSNPQINRYAGDGIPCLVFVDHNGKILADSYEGQRYVGPRSVLEKMAVTLKRELATRS